MGDNNTTGTDRSEKGGARRGLRATGGRQRLRAVLAGLACTVALLVAPASVATATQKSTKPVPAICRYLDDQAGSAKFLAQVGKDIKSHDLGALKKLFIDLVNSVENMATSSAVRSAPASVQAAVKTVAHSMPAIKAEIDKATTMSQLEKVLVSMGKAPGVQAAEHVLNKYANAVCGG
jgi:hypothetical protein